MIDRAGNELDSPVAHATGQPPAIPPGCPPPLFWRDILATFVQEAEPWYHDTGGLRWSGRLWGAGPPLYLLSGLYFSHELYALLAWTLRQEYRCVLVDTPGLVSGRLPAGTTINRLAEGFWSVVDRCGDQRIPILASSFGARLALVAMGQQSSRVERAILHAVSAPLKLAWTERCAANVARQLPGRLGWLPGCSSILQHNHQQFFPPLDPTRIDFLKANASRVRLSTFARLAGMLAREDWRQGLDRIDAPLTLLSAEGDTPAQTELADKLAQSIPHSRRIPVHSAGALMFLTHPHRMAALIREPISPSQEQSP